VAEQTVAGTTFSTGDSAQAFPLGGPCSLLALTADTPAPLPDDVLSSTSGLICIFVPDSYVGSVFVGDETNQWFPLPGMSTWSVTDAWKPNVRFSLVSSDSSLQSVQLVILSAPTGR